MKRFAFILLMLLAMVFLIFLSGRSEADEPSKVELAYDYETETLDVTITHPVDDPNVHYIFQVDIQLNSESPVQYTYTSQPHKTSWTYHYTITAEDGDTLKATATCNEEGSLAGTTTVDHTDQPLDLSLDPSVTIVDENSTTGFTLHVASGGDPVEGVSLDIVAELGIITGETESGGGDYLFDYTSPDVDSDGMDIVNISVSKRGYVTTLLEKELTIHNILENASKVNISVLPSPDSMEEGAFSLFTVSVESEGASVVDALMTVVPVYGIASSIAEIGSGDYGFAYTAPQVNGDVEETITIGIAKEGFETAYLLLNFTIINGPDTEHKICVFMMPETNIIEGGDTMNFTIILEAGCEPIPGVAVEVAHSFGAVSNVMDNSDGTYDLTYFAPEDKEDEIEKISISVSKEGYRSNVKEFNFTIYHPQPPIQQGDLDGIISAGEYDLMTSFGGGDLEVHWRIDDDIITFAWLGKTTGWVSLGFDPGRAMDGADMILAWVDDEGSVHIVDAYSKGPTGPHPPDVDLGGTDDILAFGGSERNGVTIIEFQRKLSTGDQYDKDIPTEGNLKVIWSNGPSDDFYEIHEGTQVGTGSIDFATGESEEEDDTELWPVHALFMTIGLISMLTAIYIAMFRRKEKWWMRYHKKLGLIGSSCTIIGLLIGFYMVADSTGEHLRVTHSLLGVLSILLAVATPSIGLLMFKYKKQIKKMKMVHRWLGRITFILMVITVLTGLSAAGVI